MSFPIQLDIFKTGEECELDELRLRIEEVKSSCDKVRRGMYARIGELTKENEDLKRRLDILERNICKGNILFYQKDQKSDIFSTEN